MKRKRRLLTASERENKATVDRRWRAANREHLLAAGKVYYTENRERVLAAQASERAENPEKWKRRKAAYRKAHRKVLCAAQKRYRATHLQECRERTRRSALMRRYGITEEHVARLLADQGNACAICRIQLTLSARPWPFVDHDHATKDIRGVLCGHCNFGLGHFRDSIERLQSAIRYLEARKKGA